VSRVCQELDVDVQRAKYLLWLLVSENKLVRFGRGEDAIWKHTQTEKVEETETACIE
jgi:hypothetical protein